MAESSRMTRRLSLSRELEAREEIAATRTSPGAARLFSLAFLTVLALGLGAELAVAGWQRVLASFGRETQAPSRPWLGDTAVGESLRPAAQRVLLDLFRYGNARVLVGADRYLYYSGDLAALTMPPRATARAAARAFGRLRSLARETEARGAGFVFMPGPIKLGVRHERFTGDGAPRGPAWTSPLLTELAGRLREAGVDVFDPTPILRAMELAGEDAFFRGDAHWSPAGFDRAAEALARHLRERYALPPPERMARTEVASQRLGDVASLLGLGRGRYAADVVYEPIVLSSVFRADGSRYRSLGARGPVLLVGDSFVALQFAAVEGSGDAHFGEQLAFHLGTPVELAAENDGSRDFGERVRWIRERLASRHKVVVLEVAERSLARIADDPSLAGAAEAP